MLVRLNVLLLVVLVVSALGLITSRHQARKLVSEFEREQSIARQLQVEWGQLQLEQSTWATPARIEKIARQQLKMELPRTERTQVITVERP